MKKMRTRITAIILGLLLVGYAHSPLAAQEANAPTESALAVGQRALEQGDLKTARERLESAYKELGENDTTVVLLLTETYIRSREFKKAEQVITAGVKANPESPNLYLKEGIVMNLRGRFKKAQESFQRANELLPTNAPERASLYINLGLAIMNDERPLDAIAWYNLAIELSPRNATAYTCKGSALYKIGDYIEAAAAYDRAIEIDQTNAMSYYNRGMALLRGGDSEKGCADFHAACRMGHMNACKAIVVECSKKNQ